MTDDLKALYQAQILAHSRQPHHYGIVANANRQARGYNPLCGDQVTLTLRCDAGHLLEVAFEGKGCALCLASASLMTEAVCGKSTAAVEALEGALRRACEDESFDLVGAGESLMPLTGVRRHPARRKCVYLPWQTLKAALEGERAEVTTE